MTSKQRLLFLVLEPDLVNAAQAATSASLKLKSELANLGCPAVVKVSFKTRTAARKKAEAIGSIRQGCPAPDIVLSEDGFGIQCPIDAFAWLNPVLNDLLSRISGATAISFLRVEPLVRRQVRQQLALFADEGVVSLVVESIPPTALPPDRAGQLRQSYLFARTRVAECFRRIKNALQAERPRNYQEYSGPKHRIVICEDGSIRGEFAEVLNDARKAALYILAEFGTRKVSTVIFASKYKRRKNRDTNQDNHDNIFNQAMVGLRKSLPNISWDVSDESHHRNIFGLEIQCKASGETLQTCLSYVRFDASGMGELGDVKRVLGDLKKLLQIPMHS